MLKIIILPLEGLIRLKGQYPIWYKKFLKLNTELSYFSAGVHNSK